jgi:type IV pilus assembly protein PilM
MTGALTFRERLFKIKTVQRVAKWMDAIPRPPLAIEVSWDRISAVRWSRKGGVASFAVERLAPGMIVPSAVDANIVDVAGVREAMASVCKRVEADREHTALLLPDPVIRIFVQHFDDFPRSTADAIPLLRWRLKKSVPFDMTDTVFSYVRQPAREGGVDIVATIARQRIIREYEELVESVGLNAGVVSGSSLASLALLDSEVPSLVARISDRTLSTSIVRSGTLCGYRCTELPASGTKLSPQALFDEIYPLAAYYQDTWQEKIESVYISGIGERVREFVKPLETEFHCSVQPLLRTNPDDRRVSETGRPLVEAGLDGLVGWMLCAA